ncbi:MAG: ABC transporter permease [Betaproteobacteria bacterium]
MVGLALRNLARQKLRSGITLGAIVFGVAGLVLTGGFVRDMFIQLGEALIHSQSGHLQIARTGYFEHGARAPERYRITDPEDARSLLAAIPGVDDVMARLDFSGLINNGRTDWPVFGQGVEAGKEARLGTYLRVIAGRMLTDRDRFAVTVGQGVAQVLKLRPGDQITLLVNTAEGSLNTAEFEVVGTFATFSRDFDARAVRIPLAAALDLLGTNGVNTLVVSLRDTAGTAALAASISGRFGSRPLEVRTWRELNDFYEKTVQLYQTQFGVLQAITLAMVLLSVANTVNMSVFERTGEFGTMMALGNRKRDIVGLVLTESALLGLIGSVVGIALGAVLALVISAVGIPMPPPPNANLGYRAFIRLVPEVIALAAGVGFMATVAAALLPAIRVSRVPVAEALRANI